MRFGFHRALLLLGIFLAAAGAGASAQRKSDPPVPTRTNVVLITIDTLRADHLGIYGANPSPTPNLDAFARDAIIFEDATAQVPLTLASHATILSGTYPFSNRVEDFTAPVPSSLGLVAQAFQRNHYSTCAVVSSFVLDRSWGLAKGFDTYEDRFDAKDFTTKNIALVERPAAQSVDKAIGCLEARKKAPFFLWLHLYDPHSPYNPPEPFRSRFQNDPYSGEIAYADAEVGRFLRYLKAKRLYDSSAIVVLSDHGESLGEHGEKEHGFFVYRSTTHVPLLVKLPGTQKRAAERVHVPVQAMDVAATLLDLAKLKDPLQRQFQSSSLLSSDEKTLAYAETMYPFTSFGWSPLRSVSSETYHYIEAPKPELYDLVRDPNETKNLIASTTLPAVASVLRQRINDLQAKYPKLKSESEAPVSSAAEEKLRALGYMSFHSVKAGTEPPSGLADPKEKIGELNDIMRASDAIQAKKFAEGQALLERVRQADPQLYLVPFLLGEAALEQQDWPTAQRVLEKCLELNPTFDQAMTALARALLETRDEAGARRWLGKALEVNPANYRAWYQLARLEIAANPEKAVTALEKTLEIQPNFALAHRDLGLLQIQRKSYPAAITHLEAAANGGAESAELYNSLGIAYSQTKKPAAAISNFEKSLAMNGDLAEAHLNLAFELQKAGRFSRSRAEYAEACRLEPRFCRYVPN